MLPEIFQEHNEKVNKLIGQDFAAGTAECYRTARMHVENYIKKEYKTHDLPVDRVDHKFISGFVKKALLNKNRLVLVNETASLF